MRLCTWPVGRPAARSATVRPRQRLPGRRHARRRRGPPVGPGEESPVRPARRLRGLQREGDAALRAEATGSGLPLTLVNPSTVIGHATTGETSQYLGLAATIADLWRGKLPLVPGSKETFVPIVAVDHLARVMAALPSTTIRRGPGTGCSPRTRHRSSTCSPMPPATSASRSPLGTIPTGVVRRIPRKLTGAEPETLTFLSTDRYPTRTYRELLEHLRIPEPPATEVVHHWLDHLIGTGFGARNAPPGARFVAAAEQVPDLPDRSDGRRGHRARPRGAARRHQLGTTRPPPAVHPADRRPPRNRTILSHLRRPRHVARRRSRRRPDHRRPRARRALPRRGHHPRARRGRRPGPCRGPDLAVLPAAPPAPWALRAPFAPGPAPSGDRGQARRHRWPHRSRRRHRAGLPGLCPQPSSTRRRPGGGPGPAPHLHSERPAAVSGTSSTPSTCRSWSSPGNEIPS